MSGLLSLIVRGCFGFWLVAPHVTAHPRVAAGYTLSCAVLWGPVVMQRQICGMLLLSWVGHLAGYASGFVPSSDWMRPVLLEVVLPYSCVVSHEFKGCTARCAQSRLLWTRLPDG